MKTKLDTVVKAIAARVIVRRAPGQEVYFNGLTPAEAISRLVPDAAKLSEQAMSELVNLVKRELGVVPHVAIAVPDWQLAA